MSADSRDGVTPAPCPYCKRVNDAATMLTGDDRPRAGDVSICFYCAGLAVFTVDGVRLPTDDERARFMANEAVRDAIGNVLLHVAVDRGS